MKPETCLLITLICAMAGCASPQPWQFFGRREVYLELETLPAEGEYSIASCARLRALGSFKVVLPEETHRTYHFCIRENSDGEQGRLIRSGQTTSICFLGPFDVCEPGFCMHLLRMTDCYDFESDAILRSNDRDGRTKPGTKAQPTSTLPQNRRS